MEPQHAFCYRDAFEETPAPAYLVNLCEGSLSNLQLFAEMGDYIGLRDSLNEHAERFGSLKVAELSNRFDRLRGKCQEMAAFEEEHGKGACLQLDHRVVGDLIAMNDRRFTSDMLETAARNSYLVRS